MGFPVHTINQGAGSTGYIRKDVVTHLLLSQVAYPAGNGDPASVGVGTPGLAYATIPAAAFANAASGAGATVAALMGVVAVPAIAGPGSGGTNGAVTLVGTTGTGTKFQLTGTIAGGVLTAIGAISIAGSYSALPTSLAAEPVTGGGLTGATVNLSAAMGVIGYTVAGASNHQYAQGSTVTLSGGTPSTPAVPGVVTVTSVAGQGSAVAVTGMTLPASFCAFPGDIGVGGDCFITNRSSGGFTLNIIPASAAQVLAAGHVDILVIH